MCCHFGIESRGGQVTKRKKRTDEERNNSRKHRGTTSATLKTNEKDADGKFLPHSSVCDVTANTVSSSNQWLSEAQTKVFNSIF